jgi:ABC-type uncharacterized transport system involved in gliding motility auxiliary subunit
MDSKLFNNRQAEYDKTLQQIISILSTIRSKLSDLSQSTDVHPSHGLKIIGEYRQKLNAFSIKDLTPEVHRDQLALLHYQLDWGFRFLKDREERRLDILLCLHEDLIMQSLKNELEKLARSIHGEDWPNAKVLEKSLEEEYVFVQENEGDKADEAEGKSSPLD